MSSNSPPTHYTGTVCEPTPTSRDKVCLLTRDSDNRITHEILSEILPHVDGVIVQAHQDDSWESVEELTKTFVSLAEKEKLNPVVVYGGRIPGPRRRGDDYPPLEEKALQAGCTYALTLVDTWRRHYQLTRLRGNRLVKWLWPEAVPLTVLRTYRKDGDHSDGKPFPFK